MFRNWWRRLTGVPLLLAAIGKLRDDVEQCRRQPGFQAALERFRNEPDVLSVWPRVSAEWRAVEEAVNRLMK